MAFLAQALRARLTRQGAYGCVALLLCCIAIAGCGTPVGVERVDTQTRYRELERNVLSTGELSAPTRIVLTRWGLNRQFATSPETALATLHTKISDGTGGSDEIFALAELSYQHARETGNRAYYLAASVYAFAFLFPDGVAAPPSPFDPRLRVASDLYNQGLISTFESADGARVDLHGGEFALPFGTLRVAFDPANLVWANRRLVDLIPIGDFDVYGIQNRYRQAGLGAALAASGVPLNPEQGFQVAPRMKIPVTAVLRIANDRRQLAAGNLDASLQVYTPSDAATVRLDGQNVPLEIERTAALGYTLADKDIWARELRGFLVGDALDKVPTRLAALEPYRPGQFPVVFIHGTASSVGRWANMVNELMSDPRIRNHFQFWGFSYDSGNPIPYSALLLREALQDAIAKVDPAGKDMALRQMVLIGHSQGGLLAKMLVVDGGNQFWNGFSRKPLDELNMTPGTRDLLRRAIYFTHSPFVRRVIFLATPQRGSFVAGLPIAQWIGKLVRLPIKVAIAAGEIVTNNRDALTFDPSKVAAGASVYGMTPGSPFITALAALPIAPGISAHSIISVSGDGPVASGNDGVVQYSSAHLEGTVSELVVRSGHSNQDNPQTIAEVRRILLLQLKEACAAGVGCADPVAAASSLP